MAISKNRFARILEQLNFSYSFEDGFCFVLERNGLEIKYFFEVKEEDNLIIAKAICRTKVNVNEIIKVCAYCQTWHRDYCKPKLFLYNDKLFCDWSWDLPNNVDDQYLMEKVVLAFVEISVDCYQKAVERGIFA